MFEATILLNDVENVVVVEDCIDILDVEDKLLEMGFDSRTVANATISCVYEVVL